ncbi:MAG: hypothetical protein UZ18_ATM001000460, partial [Armatimonadetes bacterium OLB18]
MAVRTGANGNGLIEPPLQRQRHLFREQLSAVDGSQPPVPRLPN